MGKFLQKIKEIFFPGDCKCLICKDELDGSSDKQICPRCEAKLKFTEGKICEKCGQPIKTDANFCMRCKHKIPEYSFARAPFIYDGIIIKLIKNLKYDGKKYVAKTLSRYIYDEFEKSRFKADIVIPVPLSDKRFKKRGFNQAELLSVAFKEHGYEVRTDLLARVKDTDTQTHLSREEREANVEDAFKVLNKKDLEGKNVVLIDDVYTTGSTCNECAKVLKKAKVGKIYVFTVAHTIIEDAFNQNARQQ